MNLPLDQLAPSDLPLLITGIAGVAGYNAFRYFRQKYPGQVVGIRQQDNWPLSGEGIVGCNAEDEQGLSQLFDQWQFRSVLNCAGNCALKSCQLDPSMAWRINVEGIRNLLTVIDSRQTRLIHLSIDLVFSGEGDGNYAEPTWPDPVTVYGETMAAAERMILVADPTCCVLRVSLPMGVSFNGHAGAIDWIQSRFAKNRPATLYYDEVRTPTYTDCMNALFEELLVRKEITGLYHAGGPQRLSLYEIAQIVNRVGGYDPAHLQGCPRIEAGPMPPRAGNVTMDSTKLAQALGRDLFDPWPLDTRWVPSHQDWHHERPADEQGSPDLLAEILYRNPRLGPSA